MGKIKKLPQSVVSKIAAGEVVENPAAIVKELVENALDASATSVSIKILNGGIDYIQVIDNGTGIAADDLQAALELHATSKLQEIEDLNEIATLGFRGEALASISAVTDLEIVSAMNAAQAHKITSESPEEVEVASRAQGTTITVQNLFRKVPARRKFLKSISTEEKRIKSLIKAIALAHPNVAFEFIADDKQVLKLLPQELMQRYAQIYSKIPTKELIPFKLESAIDSDNINVSKNSKFSLKGVLASAQFAQKRPEQIICVNDRIINSPLIASAVKRAYGTTIPSDLKPQFFLRLDIPGDVVDINVHPRKEEVKFSDESLIFKIVLRGLEPILTSHVQELFKERFTSQSQAPRTIENYSTKTDYSYKEPKQSPRPSTSIAFDFSKQLLRPVETPIMDTISFSGIGDYLQLFMTYILIEKDDKLLLIDQHAADERVKYELYMKQYNAGNIERTPLLLPIVAETELRDETSLKVFREQLTKLGFSLEGFGEDEQGRSIIKVTEVPTLLASKQDYTNLISESLTEFETEGLELTGLLKALDKVIATFACHASIRAGEKLSKEKINKLVSDLFKCEKPYSCPHGRPIIWEIAKPEIEKHFKRIK
jgi:DNA mismatch repair protein MutL